MNYPAFQAAQAGDAPILARIDTRADVFAFLAHILKMDL